VAAFVYNTKDEAFSACCDDLYGFEGVNVLENEDVNLAKVVNEDGEAVESYNDEDYNNSVGAIEYQGIAYDVCPVHGQDEIFDLIHGE